LLPGAAKRSRDEDDDDEDDEMDESLRQNHFKGTSPM